MTWSWRLKTAQDVAFRAFRASGRSGCELWMWALSDVFFFFFLVVSGFRVCALGPEFSLRVAAKAGRELHSLEPPGLKALNPQSRNP